MAGSVLCACNHGWASSRSDFSSASRAGIDCAWVWPSRSSNAVSASRFHFGFCVRIWLVIVGRGCADEWR